MSLHDMPPDVAVWPEPEATGEEADSAEPKFRLPPLRRDTYTGMQAHGLYLAGKVHKSMRSDVAAERNSKTLQTTKT